MKPAGRRGGGRRGGGAGDGVVGGEAGGGRGGGRVAGQGAGCTTCFQGGSRQGVVGEGLLQELFQARCAVIEPRKTAAATDALPCWQQHSDEMQQQ